MREGERPEFAYLMIDGWGCRYKTLPDGRRQIVAFFVPGDRFDVNVMAFKEMDHGVAAITPLKVLEIDWDDFDRLLDERPKLARTLWRQELVSVAVQREWTLNVGQRSALERLAHILCELYLRLDWGGYIKNGGCRFPLTQVDLAEATSLTPVHVNRMLQELRREGLIELQHRMLTIPDLDRLKQLAGFNDHYLRPGADAPALPT